MSNVLLQLYRLDAPDHKVEFEEKSSYCGHRYCNDSNCHSWVVMHCTCGLEQRMTDSQIKAEVDHLLSCS